MGDIHFGPLETYSANFASDLVNTYMRGTSFEKAHELIEKALGPLGDEQYPNPLLYEALLEHILLSSKDLDLKSLALDRGKVWW